MAQAAILGEAEPIKDPSFQVWCALCELIKQGQVLHLIGTVVFQWQGKLPDKEGKRRVATPWKAPAWAPDGQAILFF